MTLLDVADICQKLVGRLHRHSTKVGNKMSASSMRGDPAFAALASVLPTQRQHITTMTAPICADIGDGFESMGNAMLDLFFVSLLLMQDALVRI